jgi:hypothetical protein
MVLSASIFRAIFTVWEQFALQVVQDLHTSSPAPVGTSANVNRACSMFWYWNAYM